MATHTQGYIVAPEHGQVWDMEPGRPTTFKLLSEQTDDSVAVFEEVVPVGGGTPLHIHHTSDEVIYVLGGNLLSRSGSRLRTVVAVRASSSHAAPHTRGGTVVARRDAPFIPSHLPMVQSSLKR